MTRREFIDGVTSWQQLLNFCWEYDCNVCENIIPHDELRDYIAEDFSQYAFEYSWVDIRDWLNGIDNNACFYYRDGSFDYTSVDNDFATYKQDVLDWCDEDASVFDEDLDIESPFEDDDFLDPTPDPKSKAESGDDEPDLSDGDCTDDDLLELLEKKFY